MFLLPSENKSAEGNPPFLSSLCLPLASHPRFNRDGGRDGEEGLCYLFSEAAEAEGGFCRVKIRQLRIIFKHSVHFLLLVLR